MGFGMGVPNYERAIDTELRRLNCLFNISCLNEYELSEDLLLKKAVNYLPSGWRFPELAEASIESDDKTYQTENFVETDWEITSQLTEHSGAPILIKIAYQQEVSASEDGPFLLEERKLINHVSAILQQKIVHIKHINELKKMYGLWERAYNKADIGHWELDLKSEKLHWSTAIKVLHEVAEDYEPELETAINFYKEGVHREAIQKAVQEAIATGKSFDVERKIITAKGNERWIRAVGQSEFQNGKCIRLYGSTQNITDQKTAETELRAQKERFERAQQIAKIGDWQFDTATEKISWSPMMYKIFDLDPEQGPPDYEQITSWYFNADKQRIDDKFKRAIKKAVPYDLDLQLETQKGRKKYVRGIGIPFTNDSDEVTKVLGIVQDVTKVKKMEVALLESEQRLEAAITGADLGVWDLNLETGENFTNDRWWEMLGYEPGEKEYSYEFFLNLLHPEDIQKPADAINSLENGSADSVDLTIRLRGKDGQYRTILDRGKAVKYDDEGHVVRLIGTHMDISEKVALLDKVVQSVIEGEDRERKRIARDLHDGIGQYLAASNMNFESIKYECSKLSPKSESRFKRGLSLLKKAMRDTRKTAHKLMPEALEEYGLILALESLLESMEKTSGVNISFESNIIESVLHKQASINLYRIVQEAINNAIIHGQSSNIQIELHQTDNKISCIIKDDGIGVNLKEADLEKGLGLQSMKFRAQSMSGNINFSSHTNKGMTITLDIPINETSEM